MADNPLRPATHRSLGEPLPHQQANGTRAHQRAIASKERPSFSPSSEDVVVLSGISPSFPGLSQSRRQITHALLTRAPLECPPKGAFPYDLQVLGTPPAFVLSQDQTLQFKPVSDASRAGHANVPSRATHQCGSDTEGRHSRVSPLQ